MQSRYTQQHEQDLTHIAQLHKPRTQQARVHGEPPHSRGRRGAANSGDAAKAKKEGAIFTFVGL